MSFCYSLSYQVLFLHIFHTPHLSMGQYEHYFNYERKVLKSDSVTQVSHKEFITPAIWFVKFTKIRFALLHYCVKKFSVFFFSFYQLQTINNLLRHTMKGFFTYIRHLSHVYWVYRTLNILQNKKLMDSLKLSRCKVWIQSFLSPF